MEVQEERTAINPSTVVSMISRKLMPSIPKWYCAPMEGIQTCCSMNLNCCVGASLANQKTRGNDARKSTNKTMFPHQRIACLFVPGMRNNGMIPTSGMNRMMLRMWS